MSQGFADNPIKQKNCTTIIKKIFTDAEQLIEKADFVITPDISNFGTLDFKKSRYIYNEGVKSLGNYKESFEKIRRNIYPDDFDENGNRKSATPITAEKKLYSDYDYLVPTEINIEGYYDKDFIYINNCFNKLGVLGTAGKTTY